MIEIANQLVQSLFKKNSLQECSRWELEILADKYPYFGIAQLLVSGKLKEENAAEYDKQVQKTSLYFTNPLWLDYILNKKPLPPGIKLPETNGHVHEAPATAIDTGLTSAEIIESPATHESFTQDETEESAATDTDAAIHEKEEDIYVEASEIIDTKTSNGVPVQTGAEESSATNAAITGIERKDEEETSIAEKVNIIEEPPANEIPVQIEIAEPSERIEPEVIARKEDIPAAGADDGQQQMVSIPSLKEEPLPDINAPLTFDPYHTVDYFASQGIKLSQEEKPKDRFGQQLKSFTQWLKTIKKIPPAEIAQELGKGNEQKVVTLAEHSLEDRDIVTEAMAEVWLKQGNRVKAIEVYKKLSLQNPAKSAYFATLIEQLKQH